MNVNIIICNKLLSNVLNIPVLSTSLFCVLCQIKIFVRTIPVSRAASIWDYVLHETHSSV